MEQLLEHAFDETFELQDVDAGAFGCLFGSRGIFDHEQEEGLFVGGGTLDGVAAFGKGSFGIEREAGAGLGGDTAVEMLSGIRGGKVSESPSENPV